VPHLSSTLQVLDAETKEWLLSEYRTTLVRHRRKLCTHTDALTIEFPTMLCEGCFAAKIDGVLWTYRGPDVLPESWASDLAGIFDDDLADSIVQDDDAPRCQQCRCNLHGMALYVETTELSERLGIPDETSAIKPSRKLSAEVLKLYGKSCFACGSGRALEIDHLVPKSRGGLATFQNLQPLCRGCNNAKADQEPQSIVLVCDPWSD
jgi:5-methylcytosine-specific restriction endonuclease McrA